MQCLKSGDILQIDFIVELKNIFEFFSCHKRLFANVSDPGETPANSEWDWNDYCFCLNDEGQSDAGDSLNSLIEILGISEDNNK